MTFIIVLGVVVVDNLSISLYMSIVSNALGMYKAIVMVQFGRAFWLKPVVMWFVI